MALTLVTLVALVSLIAFVESDTSRKIFWKVIFAPTDLNSDKIFRETYPRNISRPQCGSLALQRAAANIRLFCLTPDGKCLLSDASYPAKYNDSSGGGGYECYTIIPPLVDTATALSACRGSPLCCPPPFEVVGGGAGCIYADLSLRNFDQARSACRAFWPFADLYQGTGSLVLTAHLLTKIVFDPWVGARKGAIDRQWHWMEGALVTSSSWSIFFGQPDGVGYTIQLPIPSTIGNGTTTDCAIMCTTNLSNQLADNYCAELHHYICQIPQ